jgi:hypothetical protein
MCSDSADTRSALGLFRALTESRTVSVAGHLCSLDNEFILERMHSSSWDKGTKLVDVDFRNLLSSVECIVRNTRSAIDGVSDIEESD